jgi:lysophospholipase L1-like esterase
MMKLRRLLPLILTIAWTVSNVVPVSSQSPEPLPSSSGLGEARSLAVARGPKDVLWAAWEVDEGTDVEIYFSHWTGQQWSAPQPAQRRPNAWDRSPSLSVAPDGTPWLVWSSAERADPARNRLYVSRWVNDRWTEPEEVPVGSLSKATEPAVAAGTDGTVWLAWVGFDGVDDEIFASRWDGRSWSSPQQVNANDDDPSLYDRQPRLAVGQDGQPWLVWTGHQAGVDDEIYASHWTGHAWTPEQTVSQDDDTLDVWPSLALDAQGQPWVAWQGRATDSFGEQSRLQILTSHWDAARSSWLPEVVASPLPDSAVEETQPALALDKKGRMSLAWLATAASDSALVQARWENGQWTDPLVVRAGVNTYDMALVPVGDSAEIVWLDPVPGSLLPVEGAPIDDTVGSLMGWSKEQVLPSQTPETTPFPNRYLAFGDSITWGGYNDHGFNPYPSILQDKLVTRVTDVSQVVNSGQPSEGTRAGADRIKMEVSDHRPTYVLVMEGTNDVSRDKTPSEVLDNLLYMIANAQKNANVEGVKLMLATIIPRLDDKNDETAEMNQQAVIVAAQKKGAPLCDQWQAFYDYGPWQQIFWDEKHPNQTGLQLMADTFYGCILHSYTEISEETTPPTTWIEPLPAQSPCDQVAVSWNGSDNLSWVVDYDVQARVNGGSWTNWLLATQAHSGTYSGGTHNDTVAFRVRGRDLVGNLSNYSAPVSTQIIDTVPPYAVHVSPLPPAQTAPFALNWSGADACGEIVAYTVEYRIGTTGTWQSCNVPPTSTSGSCTPALLQYGQTYYFRASAQDAGGNVSWSDPNEAHTTLARFSVAGHVYNVRHEPIVGAVVSLTPASLWTGAYPGGGFTAYVLTGGNYDISASRDAHFGSLPSMYNLAVNANVSGLEFILPPKDNIVANGGFEEANLAHWQLGGTTVPSPSSTVHTGLGAVQLGGVGSSSLLSQAVTPGSNLSEPTLSFMARLSTPGSASMLQVKLANTGSLSTPVVYNLPVSSDAWSHVWYDLTGLVSEPLTLTLTVSDSPAIIVDEVSLGSSLKGAYPLYVPLINRGS